MADGTIPFFKNKSCRLCMLSKIYEKFDLSNYSSYLRNIRVGKVYTFFMGWLRSIIF